MSEEKRDQQREEQKHDRARSSEGEEKGSKHHEQERSNDKGNSESGSPGQHWDSPLEYCFPAVTKIEMADGSSRPICEVQPGELVRCWNDQLGTSDQGCVVRVLRGMADRLILLNGQLAATPAHRILTGRGYIRFDEVAVGDSVLSGSCSLGVLREQAVTQVEVVSMEVQVYNMVVVPFASFLPRGSS